MRKLLFAALTVFCVAGFIACGDGKPSEPSLMGKWVSDTVKKNDNKGTASVVFALNFKEDSTMSKDLMASFTMEEKGIKMMLPFEVGYDGKFSVADNKILCSGDSASFRFKMEKDSVKVISEDPTMQALADKMVTSLVKSAEDELGGDMKTDAMGTDTIPFFFEGDLLKIVDDQDTIVMHRSK